MYICYLKLAVHYKRECRLCLYSTSTCLSPSSPPLFQCIANLKHHLSLNPYFDRIKTGPEWGSWTQKLIYLLVSSFQPQSSPAFKVIVVFPSKIWIYRLFLVSGFQLLFIRSTWQCRSKISFFIHFFIYPSQPLISTSVQDHRSHLTPI